MVQYLEELLHSKTKDSQSSILYAQWSYDKRVIPVALQAVSNLFPHYSLHDESHSITIINNIIRVLGRDNFTKLSAIDLWLILEAAYWHDLGMVVSGEELVNAIQSPDFLQFLSDLISNPKHGLHEFALKFEIVEGRLKARDNFYNLELNDSIRFILAEFFRWSHAQRSSEIIANPLDKIRMVSPRGVIPERIMKILGAICASHTKDFSEVMQLPFCEVGIDTEDAHPRFIACMLRIGDLLDLDNNRFSEVMLRTLTKIPVDTLNHKAKHLSVESFRVDRERIDIKANCEDYETASIAQHWFNYLNDEISAQMINWNRIVPSKDLGYLPTIGKLRVELKSYDLIDGKHKPQFTVDTDKALSLLQGAGLYDGAYQAFRELLQNSIDSSLIRMWLEHKDLDFTTPHSKDFREAAMNYSILVDISAGAKDGGLKSWNIKLSDKGTGISKADLKYLMNTGSSSKNKERINIIKAMPLWMRPSGTFGIGFQSVFMLTDTVTIKTKSFFDEQTQEIELNSPNSKKDGAILLKHIQHTTHADKPGLTLAMVYTINAIPNRYRVSMNSRASEIAHNFDPFTHESMDIELGQLMDEVLEFSRRSYFPIQLIVNGSEVEMHFGFKPFQFYDSVNSMEMTAKMTVTHRQNKITTFYKNQKCDNDLPELEFLTFEVNIHKDVASDVLTLNRNTIKDAYEDILYKDILDSAFRVIMTHYQEMGSDAKVAASMFLEYYDGKAGRASGDVSKYDAWREDEIIIEGQAIQLGQLLGTINTLELEYVVSKPSEVRHEKFMLAGDFLKIELVGGPANDKSKFIIHKVIKDFKGIKQESKADIKYLTFIRNNPDVPLMDFTEVVAILQRRGILGARFIIPCPQEFFALRLKKGATAPYVSRYLIDYRIIMPYPQMVCPFILETDRDEEKDRYIKVVNDNLYNWTYENRYNLHTTREEIVEAYGRFCSEVDLDKLNK